MRQHWDWKRIALRAWSMRLIGLSVAFGALDQAMPYLHGILPISDRAFGVLALVSGVAAGIARVIPQSNLEDGA